MSGQKRATVTLDASRLSQLTQSESELRRIRQDLPDVLRQIQASADRELRDRLAPIQARQREFEGRVSGLNDELRDFEVATSRALAQHQLSLREAVAGINADMVDLASATQCAFEQQHRTFEGLLQQQHAELDRQIGGIQDRVGAIEARDGWQRSVAEEWARAAETLQDFIEGNYRHCEFAPGGVNRERAAIEMARANLRDGLCEAAAVQAQTAYRNLSELRLRLEEQEFEWATWRANALASARAILEIAQANRQCRAYSIDGSVLDTDLEVDFWTDGALSRLIGNLQALDHSVGSDDAYTILQENRRDVDDTLARSRGDLGELLLQARTAALSAQLRINIADAVVQSLETQGFSLAEHSYEGTDMRRTFVAKLRHIDGGDVSICVVPSATQPLGNELQVHSYDAEQVSENELQHRQAAIIGTLQDSGVRVGSPERVGEPDPQWRDVEPVRQRDVAKLGRGTAN